MRESFWMVWQPENGLPIVRHAYPEHAVAEAKRLASSNPGKEFFVLQAVGCAVRTEPVTYEQMEFVPF